MFLRRLPITLELFLGATLWSFAIGIPVELVAALKRNSGLDMALTTNAIIGISIPAYWEAIVLIYLLAVMVPLFPPSGYVPFVESPWLNIKAMVLPSFVLGTHAAGLLARFIRSSLLEVMGQDFIRTARAKGLSERAVIARHAVKPALIPVVTVIGLSWAGMFAGGVLHRIYLRHSRPWAHERRCLLPEGFSGHPGDAHRRAGQCAAGQSPRRHPLRLPRSAREGAMTGVGGSDAMTELTSATFIAPTGVRGAFASLLLSVSRHRLAAIGLFIIALLCLIAITAPLIAPYSPYDQDLYSVLAGPSRRHWLGTDNLGRDLVSRVIYGTQVSLLVGASSTLFVDDHRRGDRIVRGVQGRRHQFHHHRHHRCVPLLPAADIHPRHGGGARPRGP